MRGWGVVSLVVAESTVATREWAQGWQRSWDRLEEAYVPDRERFIGALLDVVQGVAGEAPCVVDLASGTGTVTRRLLDRLPNARAIAVDIDPVLLAIASGTFSDDDRVRVVTADLRDPSWVEALPTGPVDAVVTATALHWLPEVVVRRLYRDLAGVVRNGDVVAHAEVMPLVELPALSAALTRMEHQRLSRIRHERGTTWDAWWDQVTRDPTLTEAMNRRRAVFATTYPTEEFSPPAEWHIAALREAGFADVGIVWRSGNAAVVAAVQ